MVDDEPGPPDNGGKPQDEQAPPKPGSRDLVRLVKAIVVSSERGSYVDPSVVSSRFYDCFHYSLLSKEQKGVNLTVGITSANPGEGKTLVASNLAVSLAVANQRETVLVDLNIRSPRLHSIFGTVLSPGLVEALIDPRVQVSPTQIDHLYVLPAGDIAGNPVVTEFIPLEGVRPSGAARQPTVGVEHVAAFRDVLYSLKQEFEFVIVDMPAIQDPSIPLLLVHQMDGILVVIDTNRTRHEHLQKIFQNINKNQVLGFVFNRVQSQMF